MDKLDWSEKGLKDSDLLKKLYNVRRDVKYEVLDLRFNYLTSLPDLRTFRQFDNLKELNLWSNNLRDIDFSLIPPTVTWLDLRGNKLTRVGSLSHCTELEHLRVSYNRLTDVDWRNLPPALTQIDLGNNQLTTVGDVSQCTRLSVLWVQDNHITHIEWRNLPPALTWLHLGWNQLTTVDLIHFTQLERLDLSYNPTLHTIESLPNKHFGYFDISESVKVLGRKCFHKNNYNMLKEECRRLKLEQPPVEVLLQGLDAVLEYYTEKPIRTTCTSLMLLGPTTAGKSSIMKSLMEGKAVLVHIDDRTQVADIQTLEITPQDSIQLFDHGGHDIYRITSPIFIVPNGTVALVHDISQVGENRVDDTTAILRHALAYHPENQVHLVLTHTDVVSTDDVQKNRDFIEANVHACIDHEIQSLTRPIEEDEARKQLVAQLQKQKDNMEVFLVSSKTFEGMENLKEFLTKVTSQNRVSLPEKWVKFYKLMLKQQKNFFQITELQQLFKELFFKGTQMFQQEKIKKKFRSALEYYRAAGHVLHFPDNPVLAEYVFHNKDFLLRLLQSCFHHNLKDATNFGDLVQTMNVSNINLMLQQYDEEGLLAIELLQFLWRQYGLKEEEERAVLEIMKKFHICYPVDGSEKVCFFPYFVRSSEPPASLDLKKMDTTNRQYFSVLLNCVFSHLIPINAFEAMQVQVQKTAVDRKYGNSRYAWHNGIRVNIGALEITALRKASQSTISLCVCAPSDDVEQVWQVTSTVYSDLEAVIQPLLGVIKLIYFECTHCIEKHLQPVHKRTPSEVLKNEGPDVTYECCNGDEIPRALVIAPSAGSKRIKEHVTKVQAHLKTTFRETSLPGKLLYLDCEEDGKNQFQLSWGWPTCDKETGALAATTHAAVEYREGQKWSRLGDDIRKSPYLVERDAEEFRVAAINKNGLGEFLYVTPYHVVQADELISDSDRDKMKKNHEFFTRMSNVSEILLRLFTRGVISDLAHDRLNGAENKADQLMKSVIYRCTYRQLYLFQKTLEETGQSVMAATVPVILQKKKAPSHESSYAATAIPLVQTEMVEGGITSDQRQLTYQRDS